MTRDRIVEILRSLGACSKPGEAIPWAESLPAETTAAEAWVLCQRGDWLVWLLGELHIRGLLTRQTLVLAACAAARTALGDVDPGGDRPRTAIKMAEAWARGEALISDVYAADAADSAIYAADSACDAAAADAADSAAHFATCAAKYASAAAAATDCSKRLAEIADAVRAAVPWETVESAVARLSGLHRGV
jgi:hypothetical protein